MAQDEPACGGCGNTLESASGGVVVAFGNALWHVECFRCAKCANTVSADTNLLLLADGSPVCQSCSYSCHVCRNPILDEAIMTGDDSYHASCFKCRTCGRRIDELVFAKTSQGIYCMACHNDRVARSRRHADRKRTRTKSRKDDSAPVSRATDYPPTASPGLSAPHDLNRRKSYDDGVRSSLLQQKSFAAQQSGSSVSTPGGLSPSLEVPTSRADKRRSIDPRPRGASITDDRLSPYSTEDSRAPSPVSDRPPNGINNPIRANSTNTLPRDSFDRMPYDEDIILGPHEGEITMLFEEPTFVLDEPEEIQPTQPSPRAPTPASPIRTASPNPVSLGREPSPNPGTSPRPRETPHSNMAREPSPNPNITREASPHPGLGREANPGLGRDPSPNPMRREASPAPARRAPSPASTHVTSPTFGTGRASPNTSIRSPSPAPPPPPIVKSASQGVPTAKRAASPAVSKSASQGATSPPLRQNGQYPSSNGSTPNGPKFPTNSNTPTPRKNTRESYPPPAVPPKDTTAHHHTMSMHTPFPNASSNSIHAPLPTSAPFPTSNSTTPTRPIPARSSSSSSSSPVIESTATYGAMQLPPMRFSLSDTDFADLLKGVGVGDGKVRMSVGGRASLDLALKGEDKAKDDKAKEEKARQDKVKEDKAREGKAWEDKAREEKARQEEKRKLDDKSREPREVDSGKPRPSIESVAREVFPPRPSISSSDGPYSFLDGGASATASVLDDEEDEFGRETTLTTPVIRTTLAPHHGSTPSVGTLGPGRERLDSAASLNGTTDAIVRRLREMQDTAHERGSTSVKINLEFLEAITKAVVGSKEKYTDLKGRYDGMKRTSQQFIDGLSVAQSEYDRELAARRDAEAEVTRLRVQLSGQAARLTALTAETRIKEVGDQQLADANATLRALLRDVSKLRTERDMIVAEIDELGKKSFGSSGDGWEPLEARLEAVRKQYRKDLEGLKLQREGLVKEITELKEHRDIFLEETTALNARNEELAELNAQIQRQVERSSGSPPRPPLPHMNSSSSVVPTQLSLGASSLKEFGVKGRPGPGPGVPSASVSSMGTATSMNSAATATSVSIAEEKEREEVKIVRVQTQEPVSTSSAKGGFKWLKGKPVAKATTTAVERPKGFKEHHFTPQSVLRFARCDHCGDKMWGMQMRCSNCNVACHQRCVYTIKSSCQNSAAAEEDSVVDISPLPPSMFGRDLIEQVRADAKNEPSRVVPVIVDKCIRAVEASAMDYEGIYRKTGGSSQSKAITQLFERGDYDSFDLEDTDSFNDISSITSVMKTYFRQLPNPLLTFALHEKFVEAAAIRDAAAKHEALVSLVRQLPAEHYHTLRYLMLHLSRVKDCSEENLMSARNIGVVFGPTLMRSSDPAREFGDMAGKALTIEWLVDNAPTVFSDPPPS